MEIYRSDDFTEHARYLMELKKAKGPLSKSAGLCIVELQDAWAKAGWNKQRTFHFKPSSRACAAWNACGWPSE